MLRYSFLFLVALLLSLFPPVNAQGQWEEPLRRDITNWMRAISEKDSAFATWKDAAATIHTLGMNQHQWLITLKNGGKEVGYMVVAELPDTEASGSQHPVFALLEYGSGEYLLFDETLAPPDKSAVPVYDGISSFWKISDKHITRYVDAKTGEPYPASFQPDPLTISHAKPHDLATAEKSLTRSRSFSSVEENPFDHIYWIQAFLSEQDNAMEISWKSLVEQQEKEKRSAVLAVSLFHNQVTSPFSIGSVHVWGDDVAYLGIWNEGLRFLPFSYATQVGRIVR